MSNQPLPSSFDGDPEFEEETPLQKFRRRLKEEPLIPIGCAATCYALYRAYRSMKAGDSVEMNRMFRARIYAQGFTLLAVVAGGMYYKTERKQRKEFEQALEERKSQEKRDAWLRELEIRDREDKEWRERHAAIEAAAKEAGKKPSAAPVPAPAPEQDAARSSLEPSDEKSIGVLSAVMELLSRRK
ncbi:hypoxia induced protein conserved region-domain-containing protein [Aspergillus pseudodeflectus]|uniref:Hypoxia induced protein conserved region-domain-containing protein n=2 Tax=Aspergillus subgen. Nidulantes TaxID=2720870 RepID=A0ABR4L2Z2_9EURO|nr:Putative Altered inheritance of mitochondria protein 31, mitochondrial [Aspergillus calidoustus]